MVWRLSCPEDLPAALPEPQLSSFCCLLWWPNCFFPPSTIPLDPSEPWQNSIVSHSKGWKVVPKREIRMWCRHICLRVSHSVFCGSSVQAPCASSPPPSPQFSHHLLSHIVFICDYSLWCLLSPAPCWWPFNHFLPLFCSWFPRRLWSPITVRPDSPAAAGTFPVMLHQGKSLLITWRWQFSLSVCGSHCPPAQKTRLFHCRFSAAVGLDSTNPEHPSSLS